MKQHIFGKLNIIKCKVKQHSCRVNEMWGNDWAKYTCSAGLVNSSTKCKQTCQSFLCGNPNHSGWFALICMKHCRPVRIIVTGTFNRHWLITLSVHVLSHQILHTVFALLLATTIWNKSYSIITSSSGPSEVLIIQPWL